MNNLRNRTIVLVVAVMMLTTSVFADEHAIQLIGGDVLHGTILQLNEEIVVLQHSVLGCLSIARKQIDAVIALETADASVNMKPTSDAPSPGVEPESIESDDDVYESPWKSHFDLGVNGSFGNTDTQSFHLGITSQRETDDLHTKLDAAYYTGASDGDRDENRITAGIVHDWLESDSSWLYFADGRYDFDEFQSWDHRVNGHGGVGYELINTDNFELTIRGGLGAVKEFGSDNNDVRPEALFGGDLTWTLSSRQSFELNSFIYPDLSDRGEYRLVSKADWSLLIDTISKLSLTAGAYHEFQSQVDPGRDHSDLKLFAGLRFDF